MILSGLPGQHTLLTIRTEYHMICDTSYVPHCEAEKTLMKTWVTISLDVPKKLGEKQLEDVSEACRMRYKKRSFLSERPAFPLDHG